MNSAIRHWFDAKWLAARVALFAMIVGALVALSPQAAHAQVDPACTTIGTVGSSGPCNGLLIINRAMLLSVVHPDRGGDFSFTFRTGMAYAGVSPGITRDYDLTEVFTGNITDMSHVFEACGGFNQDISGWDTSNVINMESMFARAIDFNQNISAWDTGKVTDMSSMFHQASAFDKPLPTWDTSSVELMFHMFSKALVFNQDINAWDTSKVTNMDAMFEEAGLFNQPLSSWNTSNVESMDYMFKLATKFNQPIGNWDISKVAGLFNTFESAVEFNQDLSTWDMSAVREMPELFKGAVSFNQDIGSWNTAIVTDMTGVFNGASAFSFDISNWDVCSVTKFSDFATSSLLVASKIPDFSGPNCSGGSPEVSLVSSATTNTILDGGEDELASYPVDTLVELTYTIQNLGTTNLVLETPTNGGQSALGVQSVAYGDPSLLIASPSTDVTFTVSFTSSQAGRFEVPVNFVNSDADESPFNFTIIGQTISSESQGTDDPTAGYHQATAKLGSRVIGASVARMADHVASLRINKRFQDQQNETGFSALSQSPVAGWTALNSDQLLDQALSFHAQKNSAILQAVNADTLASYLQDAIKPSATSTTNLDFYSAGSWGDLGRNGPGDYEGYARLSTFGMDYFMSDSLLLGSNLNYEWSEIDFEADVNGDLVKSGLRFDAYAGWAYADNLRAEFLVSYGWFDNFISANNTKGQTQSERLMLQSKALAQINLLGVMTSPFAELTWLKEDFQGYTTRSSVAVGAFDSEFGQASLGFDLKSQGAVLFGLAPTIGMQADWQGFEDQTYELADGSVIESDTFGLTWRAGLNGQISDFAPDYWIGQLLEGATFNLRYENAKFGVEDQSSTLTWSLNVPLF